MYTKSTVYVLIICVALRRVPDFSVLLAAELYQNKKWSPFTEGVKPALQSPEHTPQADHQHPQEAKDLQALRQSSTQATPADACTLQPTPTALSGLTTPTALSGLPTPTDTQSLKSELKNCSTIVKLLKSCKVPTWTFFKEYDKCPGCSYQTRV